MKGFRFLLLFPFLVAATTGPTTSPNGPVYSIKLHRERHVGDQHLFTITTTRRWTLKWQINGQAHKQDHHVLVKLHGTGTILAIDPATNYATKMRCKVEFFTNEGKEMLPKGAVIEYERPAERAIYTVDGKPADESVTALLREVLYMAESGRKHSEDDGFGTMDAKAVGEDWPIHPEVVAENYSRGSLPIAASELTGKCKLAAVQPVGGVDAMVVEISLSAKVVEKVLPNGKRVTGSMTTNDILVLPMDTNQQHLGSNQKMHMEYKTVSPDGKNPVEYVGDREFEESRD